MMFGNIGVGCGWHTTNEWFILPTIKIRLLGDSLFHKSSFLISLSWLKLFVECGWLKLKD